MFKKITYREKKINNVIGITGGKELIKCQLSCYLNKEIADTDSNELDNYLFEFVPELDSPKNLFVQAYERIRLEDKFINSINV